MEIVGAILRLSQQLATQGLPEWRVARMSKSCPAVFNQPRPIRPKSWALARVRRVEAFPQYETQSLPKSMPVPHPASWLRQRSPADRERSLLRLTVLARIQLHISFVNTRLPHYILQRPRWYFLGRMARNGHCPRLRRMVVLTMTSLLPDLNPPILFDRSDNAPDLHGTSVSGVNNNLGGFIRWSIVGANRHLIAGPFCL